jgi:hypothetical protein
MKEIPLTQGKVALVDDEDFDYLNQWKWYAAKMGKGIYAQRNQWDNGRSSTITMHRLLIEIPEGLMVDHINRNGLDNRKSNLRAVTAQQNRLNTAPSGKIPYRGVCKYPYKTARQYYAQIVVNYKLIYLGVYLTAEEAALAYDQKAKEFHGEFACLNFPDKIFSQSD